MGFADEPTAILLAVRQNLLHGLDLVAGHIDAGTFHTIKPGRASPPSEAGHITVALLAGVDAELATREESA